ncbi:MAG: hypothetical protein PHN51_03410 [Candidatus Nanopelagicales bacterium]|nr:hypothetical protein [Candidatus Nanopelagicales bacterium]
MDESQFSDPAEDDAYSALFRPSTPAPAVAPDEEEVIVIVEEAPFVPVTPPAAPPVISSPKADTGRLFRSVGAETATTALPALSRSEAAHLRTVGAQGTAALPVIAEEIERESADAPVAPADAVIHTSEAMFASPITSEPEQVTSQRSDQMKEAPMSKSRRNDPGLNPLGVYVLVIGSTVIAGFLDSFISGTGLGWLTGIVFVVASIYCAVKVRVSDASVAVIAPPIAYGIAALTVGQLGQSRAGGAVISAFVNAFTTLADNWFWIIGTTLAALAVVVVRSRR